MKAIIYTLLSTALIVPSISYANSSDDQMEYITVTYRTPFEYALYQYTTNMLQEFNQQVRVEIQLQAKLSSMQMAKEQGIVTNELSKMNKPNKTLLSSRTLKSAE
ncbi:hypothetical protein Shal_3221 [Shewanella halifaxensis HAW-EB4]|uniref:Uncharacterized protein n=1 Tax=Shewanella halifaxensis (strain HAW-EB4) TaxID=458817 RepID=B0TR37_SHEHH|nr:hypothetical protein [Shewanella halifaxensis]ABZ77768.1 hypothetical protein Shal_3221 [Shewanella halifaxensis HAW-EB4]